MNDAIDRIEAAARRSVDAGDPNVIAVWTRTGGSEKYARRRRWWMGHTTTSSPPPSSDDAFLCLTGGAA